MELSIFSEEFYEAKTSNMVQSFFIFPKQFVWKELVQFLTSFFFHPENLKRLRKLFVICQKICMKKLVQILTFLFFPE